MKNIKLISISFFIFLSNLLYCQLDSTYLFHDKDRIRHQKVGLKVLGSWSVANIVTGLTLGENSKGENLYFHQMNVAWNIINLGISTLGYYNTHKERPTSSAMDVYNNQVKLEKTLLFNSGLDISYIFGGLWMLERAKNFENENEFNRFRGFGRSLIFQGTFLFLFDLSYYFIEASKSSKLRETMNLFFISRGQLGMNIKF